MSIQFPQLVWINYPYMPLDVVEDIEVVVDLGHGVESWSESTEPWECLFADLTINTLYLPHEPWNFPWIGLALVIMATPTLQDHLCDLHPVEWRTPQGQWKHPMGWCPGSPPHLRCIVLCTSAGILNFHSVSMIVCTGIFGTSTQLKLVPNTYNYSRRGAHVVTSSSPQTPYFFSYPNVWHKWALHMSPSTIRSICNFWTLLKL